jgi:RNA polymerase sigma-70 factor (ECF subfamily)
MGSSRDHDGIGRDPAGTLCLIEGGPVGSRRDPTDPDDDLVVRAQNGDRAALEQLLRNNYDRVHSVCRRLTGRDADAADAAQEAMIAVVRNLGRFDGRSRFATWAYRIAVNASIDELRRRSRRPTTELDALGGPSPEREAGGSGWSGSDAAIDRVDIEAALVNLPIGFRAPVVLRDLCGLDYAEIAEVLSLPPGTVRSRIARARAALAATLSPARTDT